MATDTAGRISLQDYDDIFESIKNWGRWGPDDQRGALNLITPDKIRQGGAAIRHGRVVSCAAPMATTPDIDNPTPVMHFMMRAADLVPPGQLQGGSADYMMTTVHGPANTHLDAFCHFSYRGKIYNGLDAKEYVLSRGAEAGSVKEAALGISSRGVLLDIARLKGVDFMEPGSLIHKKDLEAAEEAQGVRVEAGDILLIRNGARTSRAVIGPKTIVDRVVPGLHPETLLWLHERDVAVLGGDADSDPQPSAMPDLAKPIHCGTLVAMGVHLLDNCALDDLGAACAELKQWDFQLTVAALRLEKGTGSPVNPIAVL